MIQHIYGLKNPEDGKIFYIGVTKNKLSRRLRNHINDKKNNIPKAVVINDLKSRNKEPLIVLLESVHNKMEFSTSNSRESHWIRYFLKRNQPLTNTYSLKKTW